MPSWCGHVELYPFYYVVMSVRMEQHMHIKFCATLEKTGAEMYTRVNKNPSA